MCGKTPFITRWASCTDQGPVRKDNQDAMFAGVVKNADGRDVVALCVADGVGGGQRGALASRLAVQSLQAFLVGHSFSSLEELKAFVPGWLERLNAEIQAAAGADESVNTTLTVCFILGAESLLVHVGDTRLYVVAGGRCRLVTRDHTARNELLLDGASEDEVESVGGNVLARCLGSSCQGEVRFDCESGFLDASAPGWVIVCSDGVHGRVGASELLGFCQAAGGADGLARTLVQAALAAGTRDNATAAVCRLGPVPVAKPVLRGRGGRRRRVWTVTVGAAAAAILVVAARLAWVAGRDAESPHGKQPIEPEAESGKTKELKEAMSTGVVVSVSQSNGVVVVLKDFDGLYTVPTNMESVEITCDAGSDVIAVWNSHQSVSNMYAKLGWNFVPLTTNGFKKVADSFSNWLDPSGRTNMTSVVTNQTQVVCVVSNGTVISIIKKK
jgi:protein phosphatase